MEEVPHRDATGETHAQSYVGGEGWVCAVHGVMRYHMMSCAVTWCHVVT